MIAGALASVEYLKTSSFERDLAHGNARYLKSLMKKADMPLLDGDSHLVPLIIGDDSCCKAVTKTLLDDHNIYVQPINAPTVPKGTERLRLTATAAHTKDHIHDLMNVLDEMWQGHEFEALRTA